MNLDNLDGNSVVYLPLSWHVTVTSRDTEYESIIESQVVYIYNRIARFGRCFDKCEDLGTERLRDSEVP